MGQATDMSLQFTKNEFDSSVNTLKCVRNQIKVVSAWTSLIFLLQGISSRHLICKREVKRKRRTALLVKSIYHDLNLVKYTINTAEFLSPLSHLAKRSPLKEFDKSFSKCWYEVEVFSKISEATTIGLHVSRNIILYRASCWYCSVLWQKY